MSFVHHVNVYDSDRGFLEMAMPFVEEGLAAGDAVLLATTPANLALLGGALGARADDVDRVESALFGPRPPQRVAAFHRYWRQKSVGDRAVRMVAEPVWAGRSPRDVTAWTRMESGLNAVLAGTGIWMICPYDSRVVDPVIVANARRTHPEEFTGDGITGCPDFAEPAEFARMLDTEPLPDPPAEITTHAFDGDLSRIRRVAADHAAAHGLTGERHALFVLAVAEAVAYLAGAGADGLTARVWVNAGSITWELHSPGGHFVDPFVGFLPPRLEAGPGDGLWMTRQICETVDLYTDATGSRLRLSIERPGTDRSRS